MRARVAHHVPHRFWGRWGYAAAVGAAAVLSVLLRLRFVFAPISSDEGGFLTIARAWHHGDDLYGDIWVDRPQGLVLLYRFFDVVGGDEDVVRVISLVFGAAAVIAVAAAVRLVAGEAAAVVAALLAAVVSASPAIEGYAANGELLGGTFSAAAVAVGSAVLVGRWHGRWMVVAGVLGGIGWSMKQSGIDGPLALGVWLVLAGLAGWMPRRVAATRLAQLAAGGAAVIGLLALHGWATGWSDWWYAMVGYRQEKRSALTGAAWGRLDSTGRDALPIFLPMVVGAVAVGVAMRWRRVRVLVDPVAGVLVVWVFTALLTFAMGGQFFHHYWVTLSFPVAALCGLTIGRVAPMRHRLLLTAAVLVIPLGSWLSLVVLPRDEVTMAISDEQRPYMGEVVGHWIRDHAEPGDTMYAACAAAHSYAHAGIEPRVRYLWFDGVRMGRGAQDDLHQLFLGDSPPTWVAQFDRLTVCDPSGSVAEFVQRRYRQVATVEGVAIFRLLPPPTG